MAINGAHSIFRLTIAPSNTETLVTDKIEFDGTATEPDNKGRITSIRVVTAVISTENQNPGSQDSANSQDTGKTPLILEIHGFFDESVSGKADGIARLRDWWREAKKIKTLYPKGRFGFRSDGRPEYNLTPDATTGYILLAVDITDTVSVSKPDFIIHLKHDGDVQKLGL